MIASDEAFHAIWTELRRFEEAYVDRSIHLTDEVRDTMEWAAMRHARRLALIMLYGSDNPVTLAIVGDGGWWSKACPNEYVAFDEAYLLQGTDEYPDSINDKDGKVMHDRDAIDGMMSFHEADWNELKAEFNKGKPKKRQI